MDSMWTHRGLHLHLTTDLHRDLIMASSNVASSDGRDLSRLRQSGSTAWIHRDGPIFIERADKSETLNAIRRCIYVLS